MPKPSTPPADPWNGETLFTLCELDEADMVALSEGRVPEWMQRSAVALLREQKKQTLLIEEKSA